MAGFSTTMTWPWMIAGDMNVVKDSTEKWCKSGKVGTVGSELMEAMLNCEVLDHSYFGPVYTWTNSHVFCKLDRVLVNQLWLNMNKDSLVHFYPPGVSDHA